MKKSKTNKSKALVACCFAALLACVGLTSTVRADDGYSIVGLWHVKYVSQAGGPTVTTYDQWHSDGQEIETANIFVGAICQGTFERTATGHFKLYHVSWTFDSNGAPSGYWIEHLKAVIASGGQSYAGTYTKDFYDTNDNFLFEDHGILKATRLTPED